jgi:aquaporin Z
MFFIISFTAISMIFSYSDISGAIFNPAISLALWLTGKLSNRKLILYVVFQLLGGFTALFIIISPKFYSITDAL